MQENFNFKRGYLELTEINFSTFNSPSRTHIYLVIKTLILSIQSNHSSQKTLIFTAACPYFVSILELEVVVQRCYVKKMFLKLSPCQSLLFNKVADFCSFIKQQNLEQVFSCKFCEIFKKAFFKEHL